MNDAVETKDSDKSLEHGSHESSDLLHIIEHAAHYLPAQGPITVFIHHNTLHAFEDLQFNEAVEIGGELFGTEPYLSEEQYREELRRGRIRFSELCEELERDLGPRGHEPIGHFGSRFKLRLAMLEYPHRQGSTSGLLWLVAEDKLLKRVRSEISESMRQHFVADTRRWVMRDLRAIRENAAGPGTTKATEALLEILGRFGESRIETWTSETWEGFGLQGLWRLCCLGVREVPPFTSPPPRLVRHSDLLREVTGVDSDERVHEILIRFCAAFLDQGLASWRLPHRDEGFFQAFCSLYRRPAFPRISWLQRLGVELSRLQDSGVSPLESIEESLEVLGVERHERSRFFSATMLALRGWAGMIRETELRGDRVVNPSPPGSLVEFVAVRLLLDRFALEECAERTIGYTGPLNQLRDRLRAQYEPDWPPSLEARAFQVFQVAQVMGRSLEDLYNLGHDEWKDFVEEIESFTEVDRRRVYHLAYERRLARQALDAISLHSRSSTSPAGPAAFQALFCIDDREESLRRHLEEVAPESMTFGTAGFFAVAVYYKGIKDAHFVPLCPVAIRPQHWVTEEFRESGDRLSERESRSRRAIGQALHRFHKGSRSLTAGALLATAVGVLASIPLIARTLFPRSTAQLRRFAGRFVEAPKPTRLRLKQDQTPSDVYTEGYSLDEMTKIAEKVLREIGLSSDFANLIFVIGHGSTSINNPHESAYDCGACGGSSGGPNARAFAQILNDPAVRSNLQLRGLAIPERTRFVGGVHDTSSDSIAFYDLDELPDSLQSEFEAAQEKFEIALARNAHERCRRFSSAALDLVPARAREHVEGRSEDLAQARPELGHATNALAIVGRRERSRGLFLDRRAFLISYDPTSDDEECRLLTGILEAVFPVCGGINLEYYFSRVGNSIWGAGTKLPHNITSLIGVMNGPSSDLRTGLPWQMVEIHEPVRLLFVVETTAAKMLAIMNRVDTIGKLCRNGWVQLAVMDPDGERIELFERGSFRPYKVRASTLPHAATSIDWYRGWREDLEFAGIVGR